MSILTLFFRAQVLDVVGKVWMEGQSKASERVFPIQAKQSLLGKDKVRSLCCYEQKKLCCWLQQPSQPEMD